MACGNPINVHGLEKLTESFDTKKSKRTEIPILETKDDGDLLSESMHYASYIGGRIFIGISYLNPLRFFKAIGRELKEAGRQWLGYD